MGLFLLGMLVGAVIVGWWWRATRSASAPAARVPAAGSDPPPAAPGPAPAPGLEAVEDPLVAALIAARERVAAAPRVWRPDDLTALAPFRELADVFARPEVETERVLHYWQGDDALLSWGALAGLARRPRDGEVETRLLARVNHFHPWSRHFLLRVLEAWSPGDASLAGRVLVRLDESWGREETGVVLDQFLRRRADGAPVGFEGADPPETFDADLLDRILREQVEPGLGALWRAALRAAGASQEPSAAGPAGGAPPAEPAAGEVERGVPPGMAAPRAPLAEVGRFRRPGTVKEERALPTPSSDAALERAHAALTAKPARPALVVGEAGVGKSALVRRLAARLSAEGWTIFEASAAQINAGMSFTGSLEERLRVLRRGLARPKTLWIAPDFHQMLWAGRHSQSPTGLLEMLVPAIEAGDVLVLGETRPEALERVLAERPEVGRLFEIVRLAPPPEDEIAGLLAAWAARARATHGVEAPEEVRAEAAALARQYLSAHASPGGVLRLLDGALEDAVRRAPAGGPAELAMDDLVSALARLTGLPQDLLDERRTLDLEAVRGRFEARVIGQPEAVRCLVERLALLKAGVTDPGRPTGVFLFAGPSGTGKTELAKTLADYLFGAPDRLVRLDMSELQDAAAFERVLGAGAALGPGGHSLAERVRRQPFCVVLLDEFEKAHPRVWDLFLQVFDDGRLTDPRGETTDFRQAIIILTSNLGTASAGEVRLGLVGGGDALAPGTIERAVERAFRPELRNRLDRVVVFRALTRDVMRLILRKELADAFARRGLRRRDWAVELEESAIELLIERGFSATLGARPLRRALEQLLLTPLAAAIVDRRAPEGDQFLFVRADGDGLAVEFVDPDAAETAPLELPRLASAPGAMEVASVAFEARGTRAEVGTLRAALAALVARVEDGAWRTAKEALLLESAEPGFWERADRFERLGRAEYLDRIENGARAAASLLERIEGNPAAPRESYPRDVVRRLAQQLHLLGAAADEALGAGPRDAFVSVEPLLEDNVPPGPSREFARRVAAMYEGWARARGMRLTALEAPAGTPGEEPRHVFAIAGFAAYALLAGEDGLHVLEWEEAGARAPRRVTARVRVAPQPAAPARDGAAGLRRQAGEALAAAPPTTHVARRYREGAAPLVRDAARGWRTGRVDRVFAGDFDLIPARD
uniref:ATP-dependent Clp protease ATP-binding subunit n=1 Tax=Eiseniibacteriota bacterium TaxID=2212470 RepID=A0A832MM36_UNCEI